MFVTARNVTISVYWAGKQRKERLLRRLASICHREVRSDLAFVMKITRNERLPRFARNDKKYNREERGDLGFLPMANRQKRDCHVALATPGGCFDKTTCHREERSDLAFSELANRPKRDCHAALAMTKSTIARNEAISVVQGWQTEKREIASQARNDRNLPRFARNDKIVAPPRGL